MMLNALLVAPLNPLVVTASVYALPALSILRVLKVATPATAATVAVPERVPPAGFVPIARVTLPVKLVTRLPSPSRALTCTPGVITAPAAVTLGCTVNTRVLGAPTVMSNGVLEVPASPLAAAVRV
jgi:hypothetical protein